MKLIDAKKDHYRRLAHEQGYRSRSSYKLKEINKSYRIIGPGSYVLDLVALLVDGHKLLIKLQEIKVKF